MPKIKDSILLGFVAGMLGAVPGRLLNKAEFKLGITDSRYEEMAAMLFVNRKDINKPKGKSVGKIANGLLSSMVGITTTYVLRLTGRDYFLLKGIGVASLAWLGIYGVSSQAKVRKSKKPSVALLSYLDHVIFGATTATLVSRLGDDCLFLSKTIEMNSISKNSFHRPFTQENVKINEEYPQQNNFLH
jgi:hypothetical protein